MARFLTRTTATAALLMLAGCSEDRLFPEDLGRVLPAKDTRVVALEPRIGPDDLRFEVDPPLVVVDLDPLTGYPVYSPFISVSEDRLFRLSKKGSLKPALFSEFAAGDSIRVWFFASNFRDFGSETAAVALIR